MKIVALVGSLRKDSYNLKLAKTIQSRYKDPFELEFANLGVLPLFNEDEEAPMPAAVSAFKQQIKEADAVLIATPEFNWSIPGLLKNALDWLSRADRELVNKPVMIVGASTSRMGTVRAQLHLRQILSSPGIAARVLPPAGNEVLVTFAKDMFDETGLTDQPTLALLDAVLPKFMDFVNS
jgi:chromate reductase, NAD(P)H dehydrogenase (quinone)